MAQEAMTELDMDVFSRRISPYFTWLESKIESGWQQNEGVPKDILKECRYLSTNMRARFILGISREDFTKEVKRTLDLLELASEAFPDETEEVDSKVQLFCKGISEELGSQYLPDKYQSTKSTVVAVAVEQTAPKVEAAPSEVKPAAPVKADKPKPAKKEMAPKTAEPAAVIEKATPAPKMVEKTVKKTPAQKTAKPKIVAKQQRKAIKKAAQPKKAKRKSKRGFFLVRWVKNFFDRD